MNILDQVTQEYKKNDVPEFNIGDTVRVHVKIVEGQRERLQVFAGYVSLITCVREQVRLQKSRKQSSLGFTSRDNDAYLGRCCGVHFS